ncbi:MAG: hypothetical protein ACQEVA_16075 [Myxococcota bacterium]
MDFAKTPRIFFCLSLAAVLVIGAGCTEPNSSYGSNNEGNNGAQEDTGGTGQQDTGSDDGQSDEDAGGGTDTGQAEDAGSDEDVVDPEDTGTVDDAVDPSCDLTGFTMTSDDTNIAENNDNWELFATNDAGGRFVQIFLDKASGSADVGDITFRDVPADQAQNLLIMGDGCNDQGCRGVYQAIDGTLSITEFDKREGGTFAATLSNAQLAEIDVDQDGNITRVSDGQTWCISSTDFTAQSQPANDFTVQCDNNGFTPDGGRTVDYGDGALYAEARTRRVEPNDILSLQIFSDFDGAATTPGTYQLDDPDYATCANCLLVNIDCSPNNGGCAQTFIAGAGTLEISSTGVVGDTFTATIRDARLTEVDINPDTYETTRVQNGEGWCISSFSWDMRIAATR